MTPQNIPQRLNKQKNKKSPWILIFINFRGHNSFHHNETQETLLSHITCYIIVYFCVCTDVILVVPVWYLHCVVLDALLTSIMYMDEDLC